MRKILYLLAIIAVAGCQKNEPDLLMGKNASERIQQNKENLKIPCLSPSPIVQTLVSISVKVSKVNSSLSI